MRIAGRNPGKLLFLRLYILVNVNDAFELLAALLKDFFNLRRGPQLFFAFSQVLLDQTDIARARFSGNHKWFFRRRPSFPGQDGKHWQQSRIKMASVLKFLVDKAEKA